jgi:creatinine amidohydrolase
MLLHHLTWLEVEARIERDKAIIMPIGSTEQHGPTGLIGTDAICAEAVAAALGEAADALVAPTIAVGMAQHHLAFPGSMSLRPATLVAVIADLVGSLACNGFRRFFFVNGHGGNIATLGAAFAEVLAARSLDAAGSTPDGLQLTYRNWYEMPRVKALSKELYGDAEGSHATPSEVSLVLHLLPGAARQVPLTPQVAPRGPIYDAADYRRRFPDGRIGSDPALATAEAGGRLFEAAVADLVEAYRTFREAP